MSPQPIATSCPVHDASVTVRVRSAAPGDAAWVAGTLQHEWAGTVVVSRGRLHHADRLPGTTNDNLEALRFYQRRGFVLVALHAGAIAESRRLKPAIPLAGRYGIAIRDEIELERRPEPVGP
jgi:hypothetical protein